MLCPLKIPLQKNQKSTHLQHYQIKSNYKIKNRVFNNLFLSSLKLLNKELLNSEL